MSPPDESVDAWVLGALARHFADIPIAYAVTEGPAHTLRYANRAFVALQEAGEVSIGHPAARAGATATDLAPLLDRAFRGGAAVRDELVTSAEGAPRWRCTVWPLAPDTGSPQGLAVEIRDNAPIEEALSRQRAISERLLLGALREQDATRQALDASRVKSYFLRSMSHELRAPLNAIGGYAELMEMGLHGPVTPQQKEDLARIKHSQQHLAKLIAEIVTYVQIGSGHVEYHLSEVSVQSALDSVIHMLDVAINDKRLTLDRQAVDSRSVLWTDPDRVVQILVNLVTNAVKYTPAGGAITLSATTTSDAVLIHVADNGPGIPPDKLTSIFEPFVQLTSGADSRGGGVGLGLTISRELARAMRGDLTVDSTLGVGSRFTLTLPCAPQSVASRNLAITG
jgi:signal transduction histidine kinase